MHSGSVSGSASGSCTSGVPEIETTHSGSASGSAAGDATSSTPTANHNFTSSDYLKVTISGSNTNVVNCNLTLKFQKRSHHLKEKKGIYVIRKGIIYGKRKVYTGRKGSSS